MSMSKRSLETLLDLVEIKLSAMQILDREDAKELTQLKNCRRDLLSLQADMKGQRGQAQLAS